jgi:hypothetical protein
VLFHSYKIYGATHNKDARDQITVDSFGNYDEIYRTSSFITPKYYDFTLGVVVFWIKKDRNHFLMIFAITDND